jgi:hypothetical protein
MLAGGPILFAITAGILAAIGTIIFIAFIERWQQPVYPDTQDDPRAIDILRRGQICPFPTDGECRDRVKLSERGVARTSRGPGVTNTNEAIAQSHRGTL